MSVFEAMAKGLDMTYKAMERPVEHNDTGRKRGPYQAGRENGAERYIVFDRHGVAVASAAEAGDSPEACYRRAQIIADALNEDESEATS